MWLGSPSREGGGNERLIDRLSRFSAEAVFILAPLPFGSVEPAWICAWVVVLGLSLASGGANLFRTQRISPIAPVLIGAAALGVVVALQSLPPGVGLPSDPAWAHASEILGRSLSPAVTTTRDPGWRALGPSLLVVLTFVRAYLLGSDIEEARRIHRLIAWAGLCYALYGIVSMVAEPSMVLWRERRAYQGSLTGTFVNRNTAATYFGSCAVLWLMLLLRRGQKRVGKNTPWRDSLVILSHKSPRKLIVAAAACLVTLSATIMTGSRAGALLTLAASGLAFLMWSYRGGARPLAIAAMLSATAVVLMSLLGDTLVGRVEERGLGDPARLETYRFVLAMIADRPWLGNGLGTFEASFPAYRAGAAIGSAVFDRAHSVPLELAAELGLPATAVILLASLAVFRTLLRGTFRPQDRTVPIAALSVCCLGGAHALVDFSLQIPGFAIPFAAILGAALGQIGETPSGALDPDAGAELRPNRV